MKAAVSANADAIQKITRAVFYAIVLLVLMILSLTLVARIWFSNLHETTDALAAQALVLEEQNMALEVQQVETCVLVEAAFDAYTDSLAEVTQADEELVRDLRKAFQSRLRDC